MISGNSRTHTNQLPNPPPLTPQKSVQNVVIIHVKTHGIVSTVRQTVEVSGASGKCTAIVTTI